MWKWVFRLMVVGVIGFLSLATYDRYRAGYFSLPDLEDDEYPIAFRSGFRAIVIDPEISNPDYESAPQFFRRLRPANPDRKYLGVPYEVPSWFKEAWSYCEKPSSEEARVILNNMPEDMRRKFTGARLDALCSIVSDGEKIPRGLLFSVPSL
ncbi:hypothetical protein [Pseudophaeobacter arcticus]|jgi:hypothetical protein|uniref:hypothetical protein n=1 Tax=Pseudophaeobacter arcticus TaxID=385492 RepID=UPI00047F910E|nr:hypothetical protein [Pseudophaeobacter arcticus]